MKKVSAFILLFSLFGASLLTAIDFAPEVMKITAPDIIQYDFDGTPIEIDFNIAGSSGAMYLVINTEGQAENIPWTQNGYLGWHTVNHIDTTVFVSGAQQRDIGDATLIWDGRAQDGNPVPEGTYRYAIWGYDNQSPRIPACMYMLAGSGWRTKFTYIWTEHDNGMTRANPVFSYGVETTRGQGEGSHMRHGNHHKWIIGGDPYDINNLQTTFCPIYPTRTQISENIESGFSYGGAVYVPGTDLEQFVHCQLRFGGAISTMLKWQFVNDGNAILDEDWGGIDNIIWDEQTGMEIWSELQSCYTNGEYIWVQSAEQTGVGAEHWGRLRCVSWDGEEVFDNDMLEFYMPDDENSNDAHNCALLELGFGINDGDMLLGTMGCCYHEFINNNVLLDNPGSEIEDYLLWSNGNGDFFLDVNYQPDSEYQWACLNNVGRTTGIHRMDEVGIDQQGFIIQFITFIGTNSFGVQSQDGTALGYMKFADDTIADATYKGGGQILDAGTNFDGMYVNKAIQEDLVNPFNSTEMHFIAFDSASGLIMKDVAVDEDGQLAFAVDQNTPNPFNPSTTIGFTIPESGHVTVDVFNVAGQKVDTLVDDIMTSGHHSVVWDAAGYSNGIYFYTIKSGDYAKTMKMTLLK